MLPHLVGFYPKVSRQSPQARAAVSARFRQYEVGQTWWANVSAAGASSSTLTRASSRSCFGGKKRQRKRRPAEAQKTQRRKRALALLSTAPARQRGAANDAHQRSPSRACLQHALAAALAAILPAWAYTTTITRARGAAARGPCTGESGRRHEDRPAMTNNLAFGMSQKNT